MVLTFLCTDQKCKTRKAAESSFYNTKHTDRRSIRRQETIHHDSVPIPTNNQQLRRKIRASVVEVPLGRREGRRKKEERKKSRPRTTKTELDVPVWVPGINKHLPKTTFLVHAHPSCARCTPRRGCDDVGRVNPRINQNVHKGLNTWIFPPLPSRPSSPFMRAPCICCCTR